MNPSESAIRFYLKEAKRSVNSNDFMSSIYVRAFLNTRKQKKERLFYSRDLEYISV